MSEQTIERTTDGEVIAEWFEKRDDFEDNFAQIEPKDRFHTDRKLCGMLKLASLMASPSKFCSGLTAEHDIIRYWVLDGLADGISEEDVIYLSRCGMHWDSECDIFAFFV